MIQAVFFDFDHTLQDLDSAFQVALREEFSPLCTQSGVTLAALADALHEVWPPLWEEYMTGVLPEESLYREWFRRAVTLLGLVMSDHALDASVMTYGATFDRALAPYPEVYAALKRLRSESPELRLAILTNGPSLRQRERIAALGLSEYIETWVISGEVGVGKPDPEFFWYACRQLDVMPDRVVMIGDNWSNDIIGGRDVGMKTIWLNRGNPYDGHPADAVASDLMTAVSIVLQWQAEFAT